MEQLTYSFCGLTLAISSPMPLQQDAFSELFKREVCGPADIRVTCEPVEFFTREAEQLPAQQTAIQHGSEICHITRSTLDEALSALVQYNLKQPGPVRLLLRTKDWQWVSKFPRMWQNMALPQLLAHFGAMILHGSFIEVDGRAIIFTAPSGTGKSTQAALWEKHRGAVVCNGDKTGLRIENGVLYAWGLPFCGTSDICKNVKLPVAAIVSLSQAPENRISRLPVPLAIQSVMQNVYTDRSVPEEWQQMMNLVLDVVSHVPVLSLACTPDEKAVEALENALRGL